MADDNASKFGGMTVNERLAVADLFPHWSKAVERRDRAALISLLLQVEVNDPEFTVDKLLADPRKYGYS